MTGTRDRIRGSLLGLLVGDALGVPFEFQPRGSFRAEGMTGGGSWGFPPGTWSDDSSMTLCSMVSLTSKGKLDALDHMERFSRWHREGYLSAFGRCFDIGGTTLQALLRFNRTGDPVSGAKLERDSGNGSLMRIAPVALFFHDNPEYAGVQCGVASRFTHASSHCVSACVAYGRAVAMAVNSWVKETLFHTWEGDPLKFCLLESEEVYEILTTEGYLLGRERIPSTGYVVDSFHAALWAFYSTDNFKDAVLEAVNLGGDTDTIGAICGALAGAYYGVEAIPAEWLNALARKEFVNEEIDRFIQKVSQNV